MESLKNARDVRGILDLKKSCMSQLVYLADLLHAITALWAASCVVVFVHKTVLAN